MPANSAGAGSQKRVTGTRGRIPLAGLVLAALPAQGPRVHRLFPGAVPACDRWRFWRRDHHAAGWRLEQAETGLTARRGTAGHRGLLRWIGRLSSLPPRGIARSVAPAFPPRPGRLLCRTTRAEPFVSRGCQSLRPCRRSRGTPSQRGRLRDGTGQVRGDSHDGSQAAVTGSAAKPRSCKAQHRTTLDQAVAAGISEPLGRQPSRPGRARSDAGKLGTIRSGAHGPRAVPSVIAVRGENSWPTG